MAGRGKARALRRREEKKPEWTELLDEASGKPYYWNELTGETSWVPPPSVLQAPLKVSSAAVCSAARKLPPSQTPHPTAAAICVSI